MANSRLCSIPNCCKPARTRGWCGAHYHRYLRHGSPTGGSTAHGELLSWIDAHRTYRGEECLIWPFNNHPSGPGVTYIGGKKVKVTRIMCEKANGPAPSPRHEAAHNCGKGHEWCIHPQHLRWDTHHGNQLDRIEHGTSNRGETNGQSILTADDVRQIRALKGKATQSELADVFGVVRQTVSDIQRGRRWAWLD